MSEKFEIMITVPDGSHRTLDMSDVPELEPLFIADRHLHTNHKDVLERINKLFQFCMHAGWNTQQAATALLAAGARLSVSDNWHEDEAAELARHHHGMATARETINARAKVIVDDLMGRKTDPILGDA